MEEIEEAKAVQLIITESEEIVLMEALHDYSEKTRDMPQSEERHLKLVAMYSLLKKLSNKLYMQ